MKNYYCSILLEALIVALSVVSLGYLIKRFMNINEPLKLLFVTGFLVHLIYDVLGLNKYYCKICAGCK
tara:strand:- start:9 stop:212 length:204 start_codon:yes stop_codon:yes gene_type:complete